MPKSVSLTSPARDSSTLDGETSRWTSAIGLPSGDARGVRVLERLADLRGDVQREIERQLLATGLEAALHRPEVLAIDVLHDQEVLAVVAEPDVEDLHDVAVAQQRQHLRLRDQQIDEAPVLRQVRQDAFDRDGLLEAAGRDGLAAEDLGHAADADAVEQLVPRHLRVRYHGHMEHVMRLIDDALASPLGSAAAISVGDARREVFRSWRGDDRHGGAAISAAAWWDLASLTKPMATAALAMALVSERRLDLGAEVRRWFPDAATRGSVRDLLGHCAGYAAHVEFWRRPPAPLLDQCLREPAGEPPVYSDLGYIILGELLARAANAPLVEAVRSYVIEPLELTARFGPIASGAVTTEDVTGVVHDENARLVGGGVCGHAGLFATLDDVARFARAMLDLAAGLPRGRIAPAVFERFVTTSPAPATLEFGMRLGWDTPSRVPGVSHAGERWPRDHAIGHLGFTGTSLWLDLARGRYVVLLTNRVHPSRDGTHEPIKALRRAVGDAVVTALSGLTPAS